MKTALFLIGLLAISMAATTTVVADDDNAATQLSQQISSMQAAIVDEQSKHDELHSAQDVECTTEIGFRNSEVAAADSAFASSQAALSKCENAQASSNTDLVRAQGYVSSIKAVLDNLASQRAAELAAFTTLINDELNPAIAAVQGVYPILNDYQQDASNGASFVQLSSHMNKMFTHMVKANKAPQFGAIIASLLQSPNFEGGVSGDVIDQLETLFDSLLEDLNEAKQAAVAKEASAVEVYEATVAEYNGILANLAVTIDNLNQYLATLAACISTETDVSASATLKSSRNTEALQHAVDMCQAFDTEYVNSSAARQDELALLGKLKNFVKEQADIFGDFGNDGVDAFKEYQNSFAANKASSRANFLKNSLKKYNALSTESKSAAQPEKCVSCRKSFLQKKLGF